MYNFIKENHFLSFDSVIEDNDVGGHLDKLHTRIIIHHNGAMQWTAIAILKTHCNIRVSDFPFDTQECSLKFTSWTHGVHLLKIRTKQSKMDTSMKQTFFSFKMLLINNILLRLLKLLGDLCTHIRTWGGN